ncbi:rhodanese-like domain-containing protein [Ideonella sp. DXS29W]|uniref:Rhodanese-like domain-containing protein n=1 Tax=Ideonella lacteola TaxID=2984193 RepID=A0ABU9BI88_9BURK
MQLDPLQCAQALADGAWLIDVREPHEAARLAYDHPRCVPMPMSQIQSRFHELPRDAPLVMACAAGGRSQQAMQFLAHHGYTHVANLAGGMGAWAAHGLPVRRGA